MAGNHSDTSVDKNIFIDELGFHKVNLTVFIKESDFVLSPSVQNSEHLFELQFENIKQFNMNNQTGFLVVRFFDSFLFTDLQTFLTKMITKNNVVRTSGDVRWKFKIIEKNHKFIVVNQTDKKEYPIEDISLFELRTKLKFDDKKKQRKRNNDISSSVTNSESTKENPQPVKRNGFINRIFTVFKGSRL